MALFLLRRKPIGETMNTPTTPGTEDTTTTPYPETVGDCDDHVDPRQFAPEAEETDPEEAGYGYGV
jgi:hypothetical protein